MVSYIVYHPLMTNLGMVALQTLIAYESYDGDVPMENH